MSHNSAKYSQATHVVLTIGVQSNSYTVHVSDNEVGFDSKQRSEGNGITTMRKRSVVLGGSFELITSNSGTELIVTIKK